MERHHVVIGSVLTILLLLTGWAYAQGTAPEHETTAQAGLGTAFTYQGQLSDGAGLVDGPCDLAFGLYDDPEAGTPLRSLERPDHPISGGIFTVQLDFGSDVFSGDDRWLEVAVDCGDGAVTLSPRQKLTPAPYALYAPAAGSVPWSGISGIPADIADGDYWSLTGNAGTLPSSHFLGTTDDRALELRVNDVRALRLEPHTTSPNIIGGYRGNSLTLGVFGATVAGGGYDAATNRVTDRYGTVSGGSNNQAGDGASTTLNAEYAAVGGGVSNTASGRNATIAGGEGNTASGIGATIGGGHGNQASANSTTVAGGVSNTANQMDATAGGGNSNTASGPRSVVSGGHGNTADGDAASVGGGMQNEATALRATVAGGYQNAAGNTGATVGGGLGNAADGVAATIGGGWSNDAGGAQATIGGGYGNVVEGDYATITGGWSNEAGGNQASVGGGWQNSAGGNYATVLGGRGNSAGGHFSLAAGRRAFADHRGCFVWGDATDANVVCAGDNEWVARATGGVTFLSGTGTGVHLPPGGTEWIPHAPVSDRNQKENVAGVDVRTILKRVAALPVSTWNYKADDDTLRHIGPMAQDFHAAFDVGEDDRHISGIDADGVALAAIQGLHEISQVQGARIEALEAENADLRQDLDDLAARVAALEHAGSGSPRPMQSGLLQGAGGLLAGAGLVWVVRQANLVKPREEDER